MCVKELTGSTNRLRPPHWRELGSAGALAATPYVVAMSTIDRRPADPVRLSGHENRTPDFPDRLPVVLRPQRSLLKYYVVSSLMMGPLFFLALVPLYFKFRSLRYEVDEEGIAMRWGVLFRREVSLTYARIQDIQLTSNFIERWLGLARIQVQTASGSASAEMTVEGVHEYDAMRDFLYARMRGARGEADHSRSRLGGPAVAGAGHGTLPGPADEAGLLEELTGTLHEIAAELRAMRLDRPVDGSSRRGG
jgi:membrane protein YdbS with pleckstrin-like domain